MTSTEERRRAKQTQCNPLLDSTNEFELHPPVNGIKVDEYYRLMIITSPSSLDTTWTLLPPSLSPIIA